MANQNLAQSMETKFLYDWALKAGSDISKLVLTPSIKDDTNKIEMSPVGDIGFGTVLDKYSFEFFNRNQNDPILSNVDGNGQLAEAFTFRSMEMSVAMQSGHVHLKDSTDVTPIEIDAPIFEMLPDFLGAFMQSINFAGRFEFYIQNTKICSFKPSMIFNPVSAEQGGMYRTTSNGQVLPAPVMIGPQTPFKLALNLNKERFDIAMYNWAKSFGGVRWDQLRNFAVPAGDFTGPLVLSTVYGNIELTVALKGLSLRDAR